MSSIVNILDDFFNSLEDGLAHDGVTVCRVALSNCTNHRTRWCHYIECLNLCLINDHNLCESVDQ